MSEPGDHEGQTPEPEEPMQPIGAGDHVSAADESPGGEERNEGATTTPEGDLTPEEQLSQQRAELARAGDLSGALGLGPIPEDMRPSVGEYALEAAKELEKRGEPATDKDVESIKSMLHIGNKTRSQAALVLTNLRNFTDEQKADILDSLPETFEQTQAGKNYEQGKDESDDSYAERLIETMKAEQAINESLIADAQAAASQVETDSKYIVYDDPGIKRQMEARFAAAKHLLEHKIKDFKEYMKAPPKEWLMRGFRYSSVGLAGLFLFIIWEMQFIGKMAAKKR